MSKVNLESADISKYYHEDNRGRRKYDLTKLANPRQASIVATEATSMARQERIKGIGNAILAGGGAVALLPVAYLVAKVAGLVAAVVLLPLMIIPPIYALAVFGVGLAAGLYFANKTIRSVWNSQMEKMHNHFDYSANLYDQAHEARLRGAALAN